MNINDFFKTQIKKWNSENKCDNCWQFGGFTTRSGIEQYQLRKGKECCYHVFITDDGFSNSYQYNNSVFPTQESYCYEYGTIWIVKASNLGTMNNMEVTNQNENTSLEESIIQPIKDCVSCDLKLEMCEFMGDLFEILEWNGSKVRNYTSHNFTGWSIRFRFRQRL